MFIKLLKLSALLIKLLMFLFTNLGNLGMCLISACNDNGIFTPLKGEFTAINLQTR